MCLSFAAALDYSNLSLPIKLIMKLKGAPEGDFRNWDVISAWATSLHEIHQLVAAGRDIVRIAFILPWYEFSEVVNMSTIDIRGHFLTE